MSVLRLALAAGAGALSVAATAIAQPSALDGADARFTLHWTREGYLRLDGRSGQVSMCHRLPRGWQCQPVPDERGPLEAEIERLQNEVAALRKELLSRDAPQPKAKAPQAQPKASELQPPPKSNVPPAPTDEDEINRVVSRLETVWRRLVDMIVGVQRDLQKRI